MERKRGATECLRAIVGLRGRGEVVAQHHDQPPFGPRGGERRIDRKRPVDVRQRFLGSAAEAVADGEVQMPLRSRVRSRGRCAQGVVGNRAGAVGQEPDSNVIHQRALAGPPFEQRRAERRRPIAIVYRAGRIECVDRFEVARRLWLHHRIVRRLPWKSLNQTHSCRSARKGRCIASVNRSWLRCARAPMRRDGRAAEGDGLLNRYTDNTVSRVRIPLSPKNSSDFAPCRRCRETHVRKYTSPLGA